MIFGKYINRYYLKHAPVLLLGLAALLTVDYIQLLIPQLYRLVINGVNLGQVVVNGETLPFTKEVLLQHICLPMIWIVVLMVIGRFLWRICFFGSAVRVAADLRERMFDHSRRLSQQYYQVNKVGNLMSLYTNDLDTIQECFGDGVLMFFDALTLGLLALYKMWTMDVRLTLLALIPALIMGNTVVFKPAKFGVLLIRPLLEAFRDSFPPGVINVIYGRGRETVSALMASGKVDVFAFIGTHSGASDLKKLHPRPHRLRAALGLDAKNPGIVLPQVDLDNAVNEAVTGALSFNGQRCTALKILFVHESVLRPFLDKFSARLASLKPGMPWEPGVALTPLPEPGKVDYLEGLLNDALAKGARVVNAGGGEHRQSFFYPALLSPVSPDMRLYHEEQFGPLVPVVPYRELDEVIDYVLRSDYGQQLSLFGNDPAQIGRLVDAFANQVGRINVNAQCQRGPDSYPFNGRKNSAEGTLSVHDALRVFSIRTLVATRDTEANKTLVSEIIRNRASNFLTTDYIF